MFRHYLELGSKESQEQIGRNLAAIEVFINNFSLLEPNINLLVRSENHTSPIFYNSPVCLHLQAS